MQLDQIEPLEYFIMCPIFLLSPFFSFIFCRITMVSIRQPDTNIDERSKNIVPKLNQVLFSFSSNQIPRNWVNDMALDLGVHSSCNIADTYCNHTDCLPQMDQSKAIIERWCTRMSEKRFATQVQSLSALPWL